MQLKQSYDVSQQYKGTIAGIKKIINEEGPMGLYKGILLCFLANTRRRAKIDTVCHQCCVPLHVQRSLFQFQQGTFAGPTKPWPNSAGCHKIT
jgi:hypothetical protein